MSSLTAADKSYLEKLLKMDGGYVLDLTDATYGGVFRLQNIDIHGAKYQTYGTSKAKKMRSFWEQENDIIVGRVLSELLDSYEANCALNGCDIDKPLFEKSQTIVNRLTGMTIKASSAATVDIFLDREFTIPNVVELPIDVQIVPVIETRLKEAQLALQVGAYLSVIFLCGSILEAVLLGAAQKNSMGFNKSKASPKNNEGTVKKFHEWNLAQFIDVAYEIDILKLDVKKFSHGLRDFRNYIHPYQQLVSGLTPDESTAKICFHVLKAALADVAGDRK